MENSQYGLPTIGACQFNAAFFPYQVPITDLIQYPYAFLCGVDPTNSLRPFPLNRAVPRSHEYHGTLLLLKSLITWLVGISAKPGVHCRSKLSVTFLPRVWSALGQCQTKTFGELIRDSQPGSIWRSSGVVGPHNFQHMGHRKGTVDMIMRT